MQINQAWISFRTLVMRDVYRYLCRIWIQTFIPPVVTSFLYFMIFGKVIGSRMGHLGGIPYILYIVPGLIMMPVLNNAYSNGSFTLFSSKLQRSLELLLISPMSNSLILSGFLTSSILRGVIAGVLVFIVSLFFVHYTVAHVFLTIILLVMSSSLLSLLGIINGIYAKSFDSISIVPTFVLMPLTYLGGVFYSADLLPTWAHALTLLNPIYYMISAFKYALIGVPCGFLGEAFIILLVLNVALFALALHVFKTNSGLRP